MATLAEIRAKLMAEDQKGQKNNKGESPIYPFWDLEADQTATVRFIPDGNASNPFFWVEKAVIKLPFQSVKGMPSFNNGKPFEVQVPCMEMYEGGVCPILAQVRPWFKMKDADMEELGKKYWKKRTYFLQGFVRQNPITDLVSPENPIRRFNFTAQLFPIIRSGILDPELDEVPTHYTRGLDFRITKTMKGQHADYTTSAWARRESALTEDELQAIQKYGLPNLSDYLPKRPGQDELSVIVEMFEASVDGAPYDPEKWAKYYKPYGFNDSNDSGSSAAAFSSNESFDQQSAPSSAPSVPAWEETPKQEQIVQRTSKIVNNADDEVEEVSIANAVTTKPEAITSAGSSGSKAQDLIAMIKARNSKQNA